MRKLVIAEKPSVARDIAKVLKCTKKGNGYLFNDEYIISWAVGHLVTLWEPEEYDDKYKKWRIETLPIIPEQIKIKAIKNTIDQYKILEKMLKSDEIESLVCATDSGREGELIFRYIYELSGCKKPFKRLWISSMTAQAIKEGFDSLKDGSEYDNLYYSAKCRSEADWLVGINASRAFTIKYNTLLSIGRVQTPTLAIIVARQKEIDSFVVSEYWEVQADFGKYKGQWFEIKNGDGKRTEETKITDKNRANEIAKKVKGQPGRVKSVDCEEKRMPPPLLYDLTELQRDCNRKFGFSAQQTLSIAQNLYEKRKMITYPRTDSRYLSDDMIPKLKVIAGKLSSTDIYNKYASYVVNMEKLPITKRIVDNSKLSDHHAIIPTESTPRINSLSDGEFKVYDLVVRRFLQVFYPYYVYNTTKIVTESMSELFVTRGTTVAAKGWTELNVKTEKEKKEEVLPDVRADDTLTVEGAKVSQKKTKPPQSYNEAGLLSAMENAGRFVEDETLKEQLKESGLGTPATRAAIIERLIKVGYIVRKGKSLIPTEKGIKLIEVVPGELKSPETTGKWEKGLTSIARGKMDTEKFMGSIKRYVNYIINAANTERTNVIFAADKPRSKKARAAILGVCPKCRGHILENSKGYYCTNWRQGCRFTVWKNGLENYGVAIDCAFVKKLLSDGSIENVIGHYPDTGEECSFTVALMKDNSGRLEISSLEKVNK